MILTRTPVRVSFLGGGSDYPEFFNRNHGAVLGATIDKYVYVTVNPISACSPYRYRVGYSRMELVDSIDAIQHPCVRECLRHVGIQDALDISLVADLPARSGLGSSSAFTVGLLHALYRLDGKTLSRHELAREAIKVEHDRLKEAVGCQDQFHAAFGGLNYISFRSERIEVVPLALRPEIRRAIQSSMMLFFTGRTRLATEIARSQVDGMKSISTRNHLKDLCRITGEAREFLIGARPEEVAERLGSLVWRCWEIKRALSRSVTNTQIDEALAKALEAGAYGGKLLGAGADGFLLVIAPESKKRSIRAVLSKFTEVEAGFEDTGSQLLHDDSSGARFELAEAV